MLIQRSKFLATGLVAATVALTGCSSVKAELDGFLAEAGTSSTPAATLGSATGGGTVPNPNPQQLATADEIALAQELLPQLAVVHQDSSGYHRTNHFGEAWLDTDQNGCDTRNDILARDLVDITVKSDGCTVLTGTLNDPYTGQSISFKRGRDTSSAVQIDHVIALNEAWGSGADAWSQDKRIAFANDPANLMAVDGPSNSAKSAKDASLWAVPDNPDFQCTYVTRQIVLKAHYGLSIDKGEQRALDEIIRSC